jgi:hypothetical protein
MTRRLCRALALLFLALADGGWTVRAGDMKASLDCGANPKLLGSHFRIYPAGAKAVQLEPQGLRFWLTADTKKPEKTYLYSLFALAGDFELSVAFEWSPVAVPKDGYGVSCGIEIETDKLSVALARGNFPRDGSAFAVTRGSLIGQQKKYDNEYFATNHKQGTMVLRRVKGELHCLTSEGAGELRELCSVNPFPVETVRRVLFFADPGGAPTSMDARLTQIHLRAEEITTDIPRSETAGSSLVWWLTAGAVLCLVIIAFLRFRR